MTNIGEEIKSIMEKIKNNEWWDRNEARVRELFVVEANRTALKRCLVSDRNFDVIEIIKRVNVFVEDKFVLDSLNIRANINQHMYYSLYNLYHKKLITEECLHKVKAKFATMKNAELLFSDVENKFLISRLEKDRYNFRRAREESSKVYDYAQEALACAKNAQPLTVEDVRLFDTLCYLDNLLVFFNMDTLFTLNTSDPNVEDLVHALYKPVSFLQHNVFTLKRDVPYSIIEFNYDNNFPLGPLVDVSGCLQDLHSAKKTYLGTDFSDFKRPRALHAFDRYLGNTISVVRRLMMALRSKGIDFYCVSCLPMSKILALVVVFDFEFLDFKTILSLRKPELLELISKKNHIMPNKKIISFGLCLDTGANPFLSHIVQEYDFRMVGYVFAEYI